MEKRANLVCGRMESENEMCIIIIIIVSYLNSKIKQFLLRIHTNIRRNFLPKYIQLIIPASWKNISFISFSMVRCRLKLFHQEYTLFEKPVSFHTDIHSRSNTYTQKSNYHPIASSEFLFTPCTENTPSVSFHFQLFVFRHGKKHSAC